MRRVLALAPALLYMALIYWLSSRPAPDLLRGWWVIFGVKVLHVVEYAVLTLLWIGGLRGATAWQTGRIYSLAVLITGLWGVSDEIHQSFVPYRTAHVADALTDLLAANLAVGAAAFVRAIATRLCYKSRPNTY